MVDHNSDDVSFFFFFSEQALKCIFQYSKTQTDEGNVNNLKMQLTRLEDENAALRRLRPTDKAQHNSSTSSEMELKQALKRARDDVVCDVSYNY